MTDDPFAALEEAAKRKEAEKTAGDAIQKALVKLILGRDAKSPFFATLALRLKLMADWDCPTAMTNGRSLEYNPGWIADLNLDQTIGLLAHEVLHCAGKHFARRGHRNPKKWQLVTDLEINPMLREAGFTLPADGVFPGEGPYAKLPADAAAERYYDLLPDPPTEGQDGEGDGEGQNPDPGGCGGVRDAGDKAQQQQAAAEMEVAVTQAAEAAKQRGALPGGLDRLVQEIVDPKVDWRETLREYVSSCAKNDYCIGPHTRVLTADLRWAKAGTLAVGERLVGAEEHPEGNHRHVGECYIEAVSQFYTDRLEVTTKWGVSIIITPDHKFLVARQGHNEWRMAKDLRVGDYIKCLTQPWDEDRSDTWLAGMFDGEGSLTSNTPDKPRSGLNLRLCQNAGPVLERAKSELSQYPTTMLKRTLPQKSRYGNEITWNLTLASISDVIRIIGQYRPTRLLPKMQAMIREERFTLPRPGKVAITSIKRAHHGPVVAIRTSSGTLVTEGLISHNCWSPPNRRYIHLGLYLPSLRSEELGDVVLAVDTSGSIGGREELNRFAAEAQGLLESYDCALDIVYHDSKVQKVDHWESTDGDLRLDPVGGGGTDHCPLFDHIRQSGAEPTVLVCLTDMLSRFPDEAPPYPVIWARIGGRGRVPKWGQLVEVE